MADILGIAAAGAGFLALAGQVLDGITKLQGFIAAVDSAPREIHDLCHELEIFRGLLGEAGRRVQESAPVGINGSHLKDAFAHCEKMRGHAESVLRRLEVNINKSKSTSALKYPFRRKEIECMLLGIERGKTSLLLANQSFESYVMPFWNVCIAWYRGHWPLQEPCISKTCRTVWRAWLANRPTAQDPRRDCPGRVNDVGKRLPHTKTCSS